MIETVRGPVADAGATLMHEHVFGLSPEILWNWPDIPEGWDPEERAWEAAGRLDALKAAERVLPDACEPEDVAALVAFLASAEARCVTGQTVVIDSGVTAHRPEHALRRMARD
ncbi:hypothetical protein GCM10009678_46030 [Actinomadura kijaniata]|uniref:NAD(P)-dependent dehydrogenase (Short-subunit alcohol dehydrogenase family) n=1 Tax=Actinomadura namibiensis TaxID=182080 RepID=A0A7W3LXA2_ACTNM|nr:SDR family oxidoreductase [Actinomadura namibiensis]MBA8955942.1 NAD(P)-dependent dehydrogenase (short-subunit alcohol dehydrogenase family) [Actinomadura namibiensis]